MPHLTSLSLSHFRSHVKSVLDLDPRPVAIHGSNGAGKTNILEAVSLVSPGRGLRRASAEDMARRPEALGWKIAAVVESNGLHEIETWSESGAARQVRIDGKPAPQTDLGRIARVLWLVPAMDRLWIEGAEGRRRFLDRAVLSFCPEHAEMSLTYEKAMRERNRLLKEQVRDAHWYRALEQQMAEAGAAIHANRVRALSELSAAQDSATGSFPRADLALVQGDGDMPDDVSGLRDALAASRVRDMAAGRTLVGPHRTDLQGIYATKGIAASECSTGEQKALLVSLILANVRALIAGGTPAIVLLDEAAAHLDPDRRAALFDELCGLSVQAWMTGTEPGLFDALGHRAQYLEVSEQDGLSVVRKQ
jgi:DNA replication and repair protein RecF